MKNKAMSDMEFKRINKEIEEWKKLKKDIREKAGLISINNYDKDSIIFSMLGVKDAKEKKKFIRVLIGLQENIFMNVFNAMSDYFENTLRKNYVFIEDISVFQNMFGIFKDRIKSQKEYIKSIEKEIIDTKKKIVESKDYDKQIELKLSLYGYDDEIKECLAKIRTLEDLHRQLKFDIKKLETSSFHGNSSTAQPDINKIKQDDLVVKSTAQPDK